MSKKLYDLCFADIYGGLLDTEQSEEILKEINQFKEKDKKITELEQKIAESEKKAITYVKEIVFLDKKLENLNKEFELAQVHNEKTVEYWQNECSQLKHQLGEKEKMHLLDENEFQRYCAYKHIEPQIKGCLDRERELEKKLAEKERQHIEAMQNALNDFLTLRQELNQDKIEFAVEQIVKTKETLIKFLQDEGFYENEWYDLFDKVDQQIKELKGE